MDVVDIATQLVSLRQAGTRQAAQMAILKQNHEMELSLLSMLDAAARPAPAPAGQGLVIDRRA